MKVSICLILTLILVTSIHASDVLNSNPPETVIFQHGVSPTPGYEGTADSVVSAIWGRMPIWVPGHAWTHIGTQWRRLGL